MLVKFLKPHPEFSYFEGDNASDGVKFEKRDAATNFNDDLMVIPP